VTPSALFAGDVSLDLTLRIPRVPEPDEKLFVDAIAEAPGGVVANAAVAAARAGAVAQLLVHVGADLASRAVRTRLAASGVAVETDAGEGALCRATVLVDRDGEKRLLLYPGQSMYPTLAQIEGVDLHRVGWVHTAAYDTEAAALLAARCREAGIPWSVDLEPATFPDGIAALEPVLRGAATVFCNARAAARLGGDPVGRLRDLGAAATILTLGAGGAIWHGAGAAIPVAAPAVAVLDTTGAGDCLAGWFVAERLRGVAPPDALRRAVAAASFSCGRVGAQASFPTPEDIAAR
jgi:ribokinase